MKKFFRICIGIIMTAIGVGSGALGIYLLFQGVTWTSLGGFAILFCLGFFIAEIGIALIFNKSIKRALYFLVRLSG